MPGFNEETNFRLPLVKRSAEEIIRFPVKFFGVVNKGSMT